MSSYATIETLVVPSASLSQSASAASANWGTIYRDYISTNLSSEQLAKGAYDAFNLLTTNNLYNFSSQTAAAILSLSKSVNSIDSALQTNFDNIYQRLSALEQKLDNLLAGTGDLVVHNLKVTQISFVNPTNNL